MTRIATSQIKRSAIYTVLLLLLLFIPLFFGMDSTASASDFGFGFADSLRFLIRVPTLATPATLAAPATPAIDKAESRKKPRSNVPMRQQKNMVLPM